jgi:UDP-N-acetylmuramoylalanine--D-glutamate ligase
MHQDRNKYKKIAVLGGGESGCGAALLAKKHGIYAFVSDRMPIKPVYKNDLTDHQIDFEENTHTESLLETFDLVIKSPGIPENAPIINFLRKKNIPIVSEIEFGYWFTNATLVCITGSNGKTTTTLLTGHILETAGLDVCVAGNVGKSFARQLAIADHDYFVLEISSFQLDDIQHFRADVAVITNITPDHLDRYDYSFDKYSESKFRILNNQTNRDAFIYCFDNTAITSRIASRKIESKKYPFSLKPYEGGEGGFIQNNNIIINIHQNTLTMTLEQLALQGKHNVYNSMAAGISAKLLQIRKESIKQGLSDFQNVAHRLEYVANVHGVSYYNDSKATNVNSTWYALENMQRPVVWIAGGVDKGNDYTDLLPLVKSKVKAIICLGLDNTKLIETFGSLVDQVYEVRSMRHAVMVASEISSNDDVVLLSPACASFDLFDNYEDRGIRFKEAVKSL